MLKSLSELALNISEQDYRDINCLSYSAIAKYEKGGFAAISHLYDKQEGDALTFGSVVDILVTEGQEKFNDKFIQRNGNITFYLLNRVWKYYVNSWS